MARSRPQAGPLADRDRLLAAIRETPDDDAPRLVYSDWLEENGRDDADLARAELIRLQCRMARLEEHAPERLDLVGREQELLADHEPVWRKELHGRIRQMKGTFQRGFLGVVETDGGRFLEYADCLFGSTPLQGLCIWDMQKALPAAFFQSPALGRMTSLDIRYSRGQKATRRALLESPWLGNLRRLVLPSDWLSTQDTIDILSSVGLAALEELHPGYHRATLELARLALTSPQLPHLCRLHLCNSSLDDSAVRDLAGLPEFARLRSLILWNNRLGNEGAAALARSSYTRNLRELDLAHNRLTREGVRHLARSERVASLYCLRLSGVVLGSQGLADLAQSPYLGGLTVLVLNGCGIGDEGAIALARSAHLKELRCLDLSFNCVTARGAAELVNSPGLARLTTLDLNHNDLHEGIDALASSRVLTHLHTLRLRNTRLDGNAAAALARSPSLAGLRSLDLYCNAIGPKGAAALAHSPYLAGLRFLDLTENQLGDEGLTALARGTALDRIIRLKVWTNRSRPDSKRLLRARFGKRVEM